MQLLSHLSDILDIIVDYGIEALIAVGSFLTGLLIKKKPKK